MMANDTYER